MTSVTIPNSVTKISFGAFYDCYNLTSITIPDSVTKIGADALGGCTSLQFINYTGTKAQWNAITKGSNWNIFVPLTCVISYQA